MQDLRHALQQVQMALQTNSPAVPALINELAETIIDLPEGSAVLETSYFAEAHELALPRITAIAALNTKAKFWAGAKFGV